jgi:hypothetical protein
MNIMQHTPIIVLVMLALGIAAAKVYKPDGAVRVNAVRGLPISYLATPGNSVSRLTLISWQAV